MNWFKNKWIDFWTPNFSGTNLGIFRFVFFGLGLLTIKRPPFNQTLYQLENWSPVGFFSIFDGPFLSFENYKFLWTLWVIFAVFACLGLFYKITGPVAATLILFIAGYDYNFGHVYHSYHIYVLTALILGFSAASNFFSLDRFFFKYDKPKFSSTYGFTMKLVMVHIVWIMSINGVSKLYHSGLDWIFSDNLLFQTFYILNLPERSIELMKLHPGVFQVFALLTVLLQITSVFALFQKHLAVFYFLGWTLFHLGITYTMGGHIAFYSQIICYLAFIFFFWGNFFSFTKDS